MSDMVGNLSKSIQLLNIFVGIPMFAFGIIGNLLLIYIFTRSKFRKVSSVRYLVAASIINFIQIMQNLLPRILSEGFGLLTVKSNTNYCKAQTYITAVLTLCSIFYPCWASFDQYVSTSRNAATRQYWTSKRFVNSLIIGTLLFWLIVQLPIVIYTHAIGESCTTTNTINSYIFVYVVTPLSYSILPMIGITYFSTGIVRNLRESRVVGLLNMNKHLAKQVRRMLIPQLIIMILSGIPYSVQTIYSLASLPLEKDPIRIAIESLIATLVRLLFYLNYVASCYIYLIMSSEIRRAFKNTFFK